MADDTANLFKEFEKIIKNYVYKRKQIDPKIIKLEWESEDASEMHMDANTPFGICCIYQNDNSDFNLWLFDDDEYIIVNSVEEGKKIAQLDFERRVKECLIIK